MAGHCASPPGAPNGMSSRLSLNAMAGLGVSRGRFHGWRLEGWSGSSQLCVPLADSVNPRPGMTLQPPTPSLGVAEKALPHRSTVHV